MKIFRIILTTLGAFLIVGGLFSWYIGFFKTIKIKEKETIIENKLLRQEFHIGRNKQKIKIFAPSGATPTAMLIQINKI